MVTSTAPASAIERLVCAVVGFAAVPSPVKEVGLLLVVLLSLLLVLLLFVLLFVDKPCGLFSLLSVPFKPLAPSLAALFPSSSNKLRRFITSSSSSCALSISSIQLPAFFIFCGLFSSVELSLPAFAASCVLLSVETPPAKAPANNTSIFLEEVSATTEASFFAVIVELVTAASTSLVIFVTFTEAPTETPEPVCCAFAPIMEILVTVSLTSLWSLTDNSPVCSSNSTGSPSSPPVFFGAIFAFPAFTLTLSASIFCESVI